MRFSLISASLLALMLFTGCRKIDAGPDDGISYRDQLNQPIGAQDPSDWTTDKDWKKVERKLFEGLPVKIDGNGAGGYRYLSFFANPVSATYRQATLYSDLRDTGPLHVQLVIVDQKYRKQLEQTVEARPDSRGNCMLPLDLPADKFKQDELYRVYYVFYDDQNMRYKGHGDFRIQDY